MASSSEFVSWGEMLKVSHGKAGAWAQTGRIPENHDVDKDAEERQEEIASPQLWEKQRDPHGVTEKQLTMRYRQEMMELLGDAPESTYELSFRDIVEAPWKAKDNKNENESSKDKVEKKRNKRRNGRVARNENLANGLLLKMFVPRNAARSSFSVNDAHSKVIPKALAAEGECWRRKELGESSSNDLNNSSSSHTGWRKMSGCLCLLQKAMRK